MIVDKISNAELYFAMGDMIKKALLFLKDTDFSAVEPGKYDLNDGIFYIAAEYETKPETEAKCESHQKYLDIQFIREGSEIIGYKHIDNLQPSTEYDSERDIILYSGSTDAIVMNAGSFMILYPEDGHRPGVQIMQPSAIKKIVVKVPV